MYENSRHLGVFYTKMSVFNPTISSFLEDIYIGYIYKWIHELLLNMPTANSWILRYLLTNFRTILSKPILSGQRCCKSRQQRGNLDCISVFLELSWYRPVSRFEFPALTPLFPIFQRFKITYFQVLLKNLASGKFGFPSRSEHVCNGFDCNQSLNKLLLQPIWLFHDLILLSEQ